jgi:hypothetical protein
MSLFFRLADFLSYILLCLHSASSSLNMAGFIRGGKAIRL